MTELNIVNFIIQTTYHARNRRLPGKKGQADEPAPKFDNKKKRALAKMNKLLGI